MVFRYHSGEEIQAGDRVRLDGRPAQIEFVADPDATQLSLYVEEYGAAGTGPQTENPLMRRGPMMDFGLGIDGSGIS
jgi:hypothetical protein